jgi:hypothetical protein
MFSWLSGHPTSFPNRKMVVKPTIHPGLFEEFTDHRTDHCCIGYRACPSTAFNFSGDGLVMNHAFLNAGFNHAAPDFVRKQHP